MIQQWKVISCKNAKVDILHNSYIHFCKQGGIQVQSTYTNDDDDGDEVNAEGENKTATEKVTSASLEKRLAF